MANDWVVGGLILLLPFSIFTLLIAFQTGKENGKGFVASIPNGASITLIVTLVLVPSLAAYDWLATGDPFSESITLVFVPLSVLVDSVLVAIALRSSDKTARQALIEDTPAMILLLMLLFSLGALFLGGGGALLSSYGHYFKMTFSPSGGGDAGLYQRGAALLWVAFAVEMIGLGIMKAQEQWQSQGRLPVYEWLLSWRTVGGIAAFGVVYALSYLGDLGGYLTLLGFLLLFVPWELASAWLRGRVRPVTDLKGLTTAQLVILWYGGITVSGLGVLWALVANSIGPLILSVLAMTIVAVLTARPSSAADKLVVAAAVGICLGALILLPAGFFVYEKIAGNDPNARELIPSDRVQLREVRWNRCNYPGVILFGATTKNLSETSKLMSFDVKVSIKDGELAPEVLSDTIKAELGPGEERTMTHYFARPTLGRDVYNFLMLRPMFSDKARLSYEVTGTLGAAP